MHKGRSGPTLQNRDSKRGLVLAKVQLLCMAIASDTENTDRCVLQERIMIKISVCFSLNKHADVLVDKGLCVYTSACSPLSRGQ